MDTVSSEKIVDKMIAIETYNKRLSILTSPRNDSMEEMIKIAEEVKMLGASCAIVDFLNMRISHLAQLNEVYILFGKTIAELAELMIEEYERHLEEIKASK